MAARRTRAASKKGIALVGCGYWGKNLARNLQELGQLVVVCDEDRKVLKTVERAYPGVGAVLRLEDVLEDERVSAVAIAAPAAQHYRIAKRSLEAGKDVFVEKPLALHVAEAEELVTLAARGERILMVGHILEYHPAILKLKALVEAGELGEVHYIYSNRLNLGKVRKEENILWSFAPHDISAILLLTKTLPEWASTTGESYLQRNVPDVTMTCLGFPQGVRAHIFVSWLHPFKEQKLVVIGSRKMAVFDDVAREGKLKVFDKGIEWHDGEPVVRQTAESVLFVPEAEPLKEELVHFLECLKTRRAPRTDGENGVRVLRVLDACQRSVSASGQPVRL